jgi:hypothetical protein
MGDVVHYLTKLKNDFQKMAYFYMVVMAFLDLQDERDHLTKKNDFQKLAYFQLVELAVLV